MNTFQNDSALVELDEIVARLDRRLNAALRAQGFLEATINNDSVAKKIEGSYSGHALSTSIDAVADTLVMFVSRSWETNGYSISRAAGLLSGLSIPLAARRKERRPDWSDDLLGLPSLQDDIDRLVGDVRQFLQRPDYQNLRVHRDEFLAHNLEGSSALRRKLQQQSSLSPITFAELIDLSDETARCTCRLLQISKFTIKNHRDWVENWKKYAEGFWEALPIFSSLEKG